MPLRLLAGVALTYADRRCAEIDPAAAKDFGPGLGAFDSSQAMPSSGESGTTTHMSVIDAKGNAVAVTCTIEQEFGSAVIVTRGGRPTIVTGGAGGSRIVMGAVETVLNKLAFGLDLPHAVDAERIDAQQELEGPMLIEDARIDPAVVAAPEARGHALDRQGEYSDRPRVQAAGYAGPTGREKLAVSDPRSDAGSLAERP